MAAVAKKIVTLFVRQPTGIKSDYRARQPQSDAIVPTVVRVPAATIDPETGKLPALQT
jgi:hypothetical protein